MFLVFFSFGFICGAVFLSPFKSNSFIICVHSDYFMPRAIIFFCDIFTCSFHDEFCCTAYLSRPNAVCTLQILFFHRNIYIYFNQTRPRGGRNRALSGLLITVTMSSEGLECTALVRADLFISLSIGFCFTKTEFLKKITLLPPYSFCRQQQPACFPLSPFPSAANTPLRLNPQSPLVHKSSVFTWKMKHEVEDDRLQLPRRAALSAPSGPHRAFDPLHSLNR